jgi:glycine/D-amino acid oxidase-like deaminating enzyme
MNGEPVRDYDVIVIGAGGAGLAAATTAAACATMHQPVSNGCARWASIFRPPIYMYQASTRSGAGTARQAAVPRLRRRWKDRWQTQRLIQRCIPVSKAC